MSDTSVAHAHDTHEHGEDTQLWDGGKEPFKASYGKLMMWYFLLSDAFTFAGFLIAYGALRFSMPTWPEADFVFTSFPFTHGKHWPLIFVTFMTFVLIFSSVTMVRAVQEGHRENKRGVVFWMVLTILGGATFLGSQAYEWTTLIAVEHMSVSRNTFGRHAAAGVYLNADGSEAKMEDGTPMAFEQNASYLIHMHEHNGKVEPSGIAFFDEKSRKMVNHEGMKVRYTEGIDKDKVMDASFGPKAFGALFFFITGFHGFHVFSGVLFLSIIMINAASGVYAARRNGYEMVEKIGLYWHFVDLVWVFVFLVFYLL